MNKPGQILALLDPATYIWAAVIVGFLVGGFLFVDRLLRKGVYEEDTAGRSDRAGAALSELQSLVNPAHKHIREERERQRVEHDDSGEPPQL